MQHAPAFPSLVRLVLALGLVGLVACGNGPQSAESKSTCTALSPSNPALDRPIDPQSVDQLLFDEAVRHVANIERCSRGLSPLAEDPNVARAASLHSGDMVLHEFFDHTSPVDGRASLSDRLTLTGTQYRRAAENIAEISLHDFGGRQFYQRNTATCDFSFTSDGPSIPRQSYTSAARMLVENWMGSSGHRRNLLDPELTRHGAGVAIRPDPEICGTLVAVQNFAG